MEGRRLDAKFAESASLLAQIFGEAKPSTRRYEEAARDSVWREVCAFLDAAARERRPVTLNELELFVDHMLERPGVANSSALQSNQRAL